MQECKSQESAEGTDPADSRCSGNTMCNTGQEEVAHYSPRREPSNRLDFCRVFNRILNDAKYFHHLFL